MNCWYTVGESQQGLVTTFGKVTGVAEAGIHFKLPDPIQSVKILEVNKTQQLQIGYLTDKNNNDVSVETVSKMITGDYSIVNIDFFIEWKISDPAKYLYSSDDPKSILKNVVQSSARDVVGTKNVDGVLTTEKSTIQAEMKDLIIEKLTLQDIGVTVLQVKIQDAEPPTPEVINAFKSVETAKQERETYINQSLAYQNSKLPDAKSQADQIVREAESYKQTRINEATGEVARFEQMYAEYSKFKEISKTRMYLEAMESILPGVKVYIDTSSNGVQKLLPLETFSGN
ncbi:Modulator of FtsH protease HflK [bioreactor metagenome]|uniref:Modulator of FtsH protease HflK n=1 Tax=bioreactor metagenome TaxID=1076179 RepID=A0A645BB32_9ZZZZ